MSSYSDTITAEQAINLLNGRFQLDLMLKLSKLDISDFQRLSRTDKLRVALKRVLRVSWNQQHDGEWKPACGQGVAIKRIEEWATSAVYAQMMNRH
ncbi:hypothetical protein NCS52_01253700 [Fusarium sp. LHS14.1]|nr:hypothetical protein NCS52_01253700 [Fusarium sp. LHS14.1]